MSILLPGQYPRSEKLIQATRDFDRKRKTLEEVRESVLHDVKALEDLQKGFKYKTSGLFEWQDLLRPFSHIIEGAQEGTLTRYFETNTFWRELEAKSHSVKQQEIDRFFAHTDLITLPFLYVFQKYSKGLSLDSIESCLYEVASYLLKKPNKALAFFEPTLGFRKLEEAEKKIGRKLIENIKKGSSNPVYIYSSYYPIENEMSFLSSLAVDGIGVDFYANSIDAIMPKFPKDKELLAGIISTETTRIESEEGVSTFKKMIKDFIPTFLVIPNGPPQFLPRTIMDLKIKNMRELLQ